MFFVKKAISIVFIFLVLLTGCSSSDKIEDVNTKGSGSFTSSDIVFDYDGLQIELNEEIADCLDKLSSLEEYEYSEASSCYYPGLDKTYQWDGLQLITYPNPDGSERVCQITLLNDKFKTTKGVAVGGSADDVVKAYGEDYSKEGLAYRYSVDETHYLDVFVLNDKVDSIAYPLIP